MIPPVLAFHRSKTDFSVERWLEVASHSDKEGDGSYAGSSAVAIFCRNTLPVWKYSVGTFLIVIICATESRADREYVRCG